MTEGGRIEYAGDATSPLTLDPSVPFIDLPDGCDEDPIGERCDVCDWGGRLDRLFFPYRRPSRQSLRGGASRCSSCKARLLILEDITQDEGIHPEAGDMLDISGWRSVGFNRSPSKYEIFLPSELPRSYVSGIYETTRRRTSLSTMDQSIIWARNLILDCSSLHKGCVEQAEGSLTPTRLIDVSPDGMDLDVRLVESTTIPPDTTREYAALSYCWGSYKPACMTTPMTIESNLRCIPWNSLPPTFRDAVIFTRGLGLKYLWIDSICIIQDDENDWHKEAGRMFNVYKGSKVTLGAVFGDDSTAGLRDINTAAKQQARHVANLRLGKDEWPIFIRRHHYLWERKAQDDWLSYADANIRVPLLSRAWAYQERILPPRALLFTEGEIIYQCTTAIECECGSATDAWYNIVDCDKRKITLATQLATANRTKGHILEIQETWRYMVANTYSALHVTNPEDRLVALSAVAEQFQHVRSGSEYLAGLWSDSLIDDLVWAPKPGCDRPFNLPTWSWASVSGGIYYAVMPKRRQYMAEVVEATCVYTKENRFGILESSKLVLRSRMLPCSLREDGSVQAGPGDATWTAYCCWLDGSWSAAHHDESEVVYLLQMAQDDFAGIHVKCLILRLEHHAAKRLFSRVGMVEYNTRDAQDILLHRAFEERGEVVECEII